MIIPRIDTNHTPSLRIGIFSDTFAPQVNGVAVSLQLIVQGLREAGHDVTVFAPRFSGFEEKEAKIYDFPPLKNLHKASMYVAVSGSSRAARSKDRNQFDVLHAHSPLSLGLLAYLTASVDNLPLIYTHHTPIEDYGRYVRVTGEAHLMRHIKRWLSAASTNIGDQVIVPSDRLKGLLLAQKVMRNIQVIPNGVELERFRRSKIKASGLYHDRLGLHPDSPLLLYVGRLEPEKNLTFLLDSFEIVSKIYGNVHLVFAGDGSARKDLEARAASMSNGKRIHFFGTVNRVDLPDLLHEASMFLSASVNEAHPTSLIEAIAAGLPVIAVKDESLEGMVVDGGNGRAVPPDLDLFSEAICDLLANPEFMELFARRSEELSEKFSIESQVGSLLKLYNAAVLQNWRGWDSDRRRIFSEWK